MLRDLSELRSGDPVVHVQHGIGRYRGLVDLDLGEGAAEFLLLEYAEENKLYVPVAQLHSIAANRGGPRGQPPRPKRGAARGGKARPKPPRPGRAPPPEFSNPNARPPPPQGPA